MGPPHPCWEDGHTSSPWPAAPRISCCLHPLLCSQSFGIDGENLRQIDRNTLVWSDPTLLLKILFLQGLCFTLSEHLISSWRQTTGFEWTVASLEGRALQVCTGPGIGPIAYPCNLSGAMARMRSRGHGSHALCACQVLAALTRHRWASCSPDTPGEYSLSS